MRNKSVIGTVVGAVALFVGGAYYFFKKKKVETQKPAEQAESPQQAPETDFSEDESPQ